jgi:hypothetical protein
MHRLVARFVDKGCASVDLKDEADIPRALDELLKRVKKVFPDKVIEKIERATYLPEYRYKFRYDDVEIDLATFVYTPDPAAAAPTPSAAPVKSARPKERPLREAPRTTPAPVTPEGTLEERLEHLLDRVAAHRAAHKPAS